MKDSDRAAVALRQIWSLLRVLGFILAIFAVCFAAFGCMVYLEDNDLRNRIREMEGQLSKATDAPNLFINDDHKGEGELYEDDKVREVPDWIRSIHEVIPILTNKTNAKQIDSSQKYVNVLTRVRRRARRKGRGQKKKRPCDGCCRICHCSKGNGKKRRGKNDRRNCQSCCKVCAGQCGKPDSDTPTGAEPDNSFFRDRLGHFLGSKDINLCKDIGSIDRRRPYDRETKTGYICGWQYADWMKRGAKDLYILDVKTGIVTVTEKGIYYVYGQLVMHDSRPTASMGIMMEVNNEVVEIAKCLETAGYLIGEGGYIADSGGTFRTCHMGSITELDKNAKVYVYVHVPKNSKGKAIPFTTFHSNMTTFFGAIKYA